MRLLLPRTKLKKSRADPLSVRNFSIWPDPEAEKAAGQQVKFAGSMKRLGDWVYFIGELVDDRGRPVSVRNLSPEALALWKRVNGQWKVLDVGTGITDAYYYEVWPRDFRVPMELLRAN